jgi:hypothetical protein
MGMEGFALLFAIMALAGLSLLGYEYWDTNTISLSPRGWLVLIFDKLLYRLLRIDNPQKARIWGWRMFLGSLVPFALFMATKGGCPKRSAPRLF